MLTDPGDPRITDPEPTTEEALRSGGTTMTDRADPGAIDPADGAADYDPAVLEAVHRVEVATEWIERGFGALLDAHHRVGHAQGLLLEAADALTACGAHELGERARTVIAPLDAIHDRWTFQIVDEFRMHLLDPARVFDDDVRSELVGGLRHRFEALQKRLTEGSTSTTRVRTPPTAPG